jgi:hypothetical protein
MDGLRERRPARLLSTYHIHTVRLMTSAGVEGLPAHWPDLSGTYTISLGRSTIGGQKIARTSR